MADLLTAYSLGYEGVTLDQCVEVLKKSEISLVVDVRETPWSYKPGFSRKPLEARLSAEGISYVHLKSAGNPSKYRKAGLPQAEVISNYRKHLAANPSCLGEIIEFIRQTSGRGGVCLLCFEREPVDCHRKVILDKLLEQKHRLAVSHLRIGETVPAGSKKRLTSRRIPKTDNCKRSGVHVKVAKDKRRAIAV